MGKIVLFDPSISTLNRGDEIIAESCEKNFAFNSKKDFIIRISTHFPLSNRFLDIIGEPDFSFVLGSNLLRGKVNHRFKPWHLKMNNAKRIKGVILMGVGWWSYNDKPNLFTKILYRRILNKEYFHSVRDEYTKQILEKMGIKNVINTGCPTMWQLTKQHCEKIPTLKKENVVFTLTDYNRDINKDKQLIETLFHNYKKVYFWIQGWGDLAYLKSLIDEATFQKINLIGSSLREYEDFLYKHDCDYVGTRLHAGIKALQCYKRSIIIAIDNRAIELNKDYHLVILNRENINNLGGLICENFKTQITINEEGISKWLSQFETEE